MSTRVITNQIRGTLTTLDRLGGTLPDDVAGTLHAALDVATRAQQWERTSDATPVSAAVLDAIAAGRDAATDPAVTKAIADEAVRQALPAVIERAGNRLQIIATDHIDDLIHAFDKPYDDAAEALAKARDWLSAHGISHDSDPSTVLNQGPDAAAKWSQLLKATDQLTRIRNTIGPLLTVLELRVSVLNYVDPAGQGLAKLANLPTIGRLGLESNPHPWAVLDAGMVLALAGPLEVEERRADAEAVDDNYQQEQQAEAKRRWPVSF